LNPEDALANAVAAWRASPDRAALGRVARAQAVSPCGRRRSQRGVLIVKWTVIAALGSFAVLIIGRLAKILYRHCSIGAAARRPAI
jgi:hypothetical protein